jgi:hypothetical protein
VNTPIDIKHTLQTEADAISQIQAEAQAAVAAELAAIGAAEEK